LFSGTVISLHPRIGTPVRNLTPATTFVGPRPAIGYAVRNER
jgi:hypothetical protein